MGTRTVRAMTIKPHHFSGITTKGLLVTAVVFSHAMLTVAFFLSPGAPPMVDTIRVYDAPVLSLLAWLGAVVKHDALFFFQQSREPLLLSLVLILGSLMWGGIAWGAVTIGERFSVAKHRGRFR